MFTDGQNIAKSCGQIDLKITAYLIVFNPSCTKVYVFGTHTFYEGGWAPPMISKTADSTNFNFGRPLGLSMRGRKQVEIMM